MQYAVWTAITYIYALCGCIVRMLVIDSVFSTQRIMKIITFEQTLSKICRAWGASKASTEVLRDTTTPYGSHPGEARLWLRRDESLLTILI